VPALLTLEGPRNLGCVGCTRPTSQNVPFAGLGSRVLEPTRPCINCTPTSTVLTGLQGSFDVTGFLSSPFMLALIGLGIGAFFAYRKLPRKR
jgi:hypothetical protein